MNILQYFMFQNSLTPILNRKRNDDTQINDSKEPTDEEVTTPDSNPKMPTVEFKLVEDLR